MTAHPLDDLATIRSHEMTCTWTYGEGKAVPAVLTITRDRDGWCVAVTPDGWATLWLSGDEAQPWGPWRSNSLLRWFPTARDAVDAALATDQIGGVG